MQLPLNRREENLKESLDACLEATLQDGQQAPDFEEADGLFSMLREARASKADARKRLAFRLAQAQACDASDAVENTPIAPVSHEAILELGNPLGTFLEERSAACHGADNCKSQ